MTVELLYVYVLLGLITAAALWAAGTDRHPPED
jgi:hypothetical protein